MLYFAYGSNLNEDVKLPEKDASELELDERDLIGWAYFLTKEFEESVFHLEKAVVMLPNDATLNDHLGDAYWMSNRKSEALSQWKKVLILDPEYKTKNSKSSQEKAVHDALTIR